MSKRSVIISFVALVAMIGLIALGMHYLYLDNDVTEDVTEVPDSPQYMLLSAVPVDAVAVGNFSEPEKILPKIISNGEFAKSVSDRIGSHEEVLTQMVVSLHYIGRLCPLYVFDTGIAQSQPSALAQSILSAAEQSGMYAEYLDCSTIGSSRRISGHSIVLASPAKEMVLSSKRHLRASESVLKAAGFIYTHKKASGDNCLYISGALSNHIAVSLFHWNMNSFFGVGKKMTDWVVFDVEELTAESDKYFGKLVSDAKHPDVFSIFADCGVLTSEVSKMLPSYTVSAFTLPIRRRTEFVSSYEAYLDSKQGLQRKLILRNRLKDKTNVTPEEFCTRLDVSEVATASFNINGKLHRVNLTKVGKVDKALISSDTKLMEYKFGSYVGSVFGDLFIFKDESYYTYIDGWIISGSRDAIQKYVDKEALHYNLKEYMENAGLSDMFSKAAAFMAYVSFTVEPEMMPKIFSNSTLATLSKTYEGVDYAGAFVTVGENGHTENVQVEIFRNAILRSKAPFRAKDTVVVIPTGPYPVKNARTGKENYFYQSATNNYLCLKDENGKGVWGVPFSSSICGAAQSIDHLGNGKYQILFGSGTKLYLIDILGRFVGDILVDLGKEIHVGPHVYDFNGDGKYNVMVLHKDNTIEMYDLKGQHPAEWTTIKSANLIKGLPERIEVGGTTYWVVRTSLQTLIFPFMGGESLTTFVGDQMALPDTEVTVLDDTSVEVESYDGKKRTIKLR